MSETDSIQRVFKIWENPFENVDILQSRQDKWYNV